MNLFQFDETWALIAGVAKGLHVLYLEISRGSFEIRTFFSLALKNVGSHMWGFTVFDNPKHDQRKQNQRSKGVLRFFFAPFMDCAIELDSFTLTIS